MSLSTSPNKASTVVKKDDLSNAPRASDVFEISGRYYDPIRHALNVYRRTKNLYDRTRKALGRQSTIYISSAATKDVKVSNNESVRSTS